MWQGLVFAAVDEANAPQFDAFVAGIDARLGANRHLESYGHHHRVGYDVACNWKVYVDNYLEGYHIPIVHPSLHRELDYQRYRTETFDHFSIQHAPIRGTAEPRLRVVDGVSAEAQYFWVFPNLMLNVYPDNFSTNLIVPLGPERTLTVFEWFFAPGAGEAARRAVEETVAFSDEVQVEDVAMCETVQRNLRSRSYGSGRYSVRRENGVHHFHGLLARYLAGSPL